jgi:hypothetical protein
MVADRGTKYVTLGKPHITKVKKKERIFISTRMHLHSLLPKHSYKVRILH